MLTAQLGFLPGRMLRLTHGVDFSGWTYQFYMSVALAVLFLDSAWSLLIPDDCQV
jgi:hypothetical protein